MNSSMELILFRHAHKGITPLADPELSNLGFEQAKKLAVMIETKQLAPPTHAWCSERIRTKQTMVPACDLRQIEIETSSLLNVRGYSETAEVFRERIKKFLNLMESLSETVGSATQLHYVCSHYDWIEESLIFIPCDQDLTTFEYSSWAPGQYLHFRVGKYAWKLLGKGLIK